MLGLAAIAAPLAAPFWKSPRAHWLNAAPAAFLLLFTLRLALAIYHADQASSALQQQFGVELDDSMKEAQSAIRNEMIKAFLGTLGWGIWLLILSSGTLFVQALRAQRPALAASVATAAGQIARKPFDRRWLVGGAVAVVAVGGVWGVVALAGRLLESPEARAKKLFADLNTVIVGAKGDCQALGKGMRAFFEERDDDFAAIAKLPPEAAQSLESELMLGMQRAQFAVGNHFMLCANNPDFGAAAVALREQFGLVAASLQRTPTRAAAIKPEPASAAAKQGPASAAAKQEPSLWDRLFSKPAEPPPPAVVPQKAPMAPAAAPVPAPPPAPPAPAAVVAQPEVVPAEPAAEVAAAVAAPVAPPAAALAPTISGNFAVFDVVAGDSLNARSAPLPSAPKVFELAPASRGWAAVGKSSAGDWLQLRGPSGVGWVSRSFVIEDRPNACALPSLSMLADKLLLAIERQDGALLASLISSLHGLQVRLDVKGTGVRVKAADAPSLFTSTASQSWHLGSAGAFKDIVQPLLTRSVGDQAPRACGRLVAPPGAPVPSPWPVELRALTPLSIGGSKPDVESWVLGIELIEGEPKLAALVRYAPLPSAPPAAAAAAPKPAPVAAKAATPPDAVPAAKAAVAEKPAAEKPAAEPAAEEPTRSKRRRRAKDK